MMSSDLLGAVDIFKVLLVDDHAIFRQGLRQVLLFEFPHFQFTEMASGQAALEAIRQDTFDLVLLDLNLPDKSGMEVLKEAKSGGLAAPVIVMSVNPEEQYGFRVLKAHGASYLRKDCEHEDLYQCVRTVCQGKKYVTSSLGERLAQLAYGQDPSALHHTLSDREFEVLRLLAMGRTPTDVANHLALSVKTVSSHRARLLEKLHLQTTAGLIRYAIIHELLNDS